jgi:hypothetical protein
MMLNAGLNELLSVVLGLVESNYCGHSHLFENWHVVLRRERPVAVCLVQGARERYELAWKCPVEISVLDFFVVLVLLDVKRLVVIPPESHRVLKAGQAVVNRALVSARAHRRVTEWHELRVIWSEEFPRIHVAAAQDDDHVAAHEKCGIRLLGVVHGRVVVDLKLLVAGIAHQFL